MHVSIPCPSCAQPIRFGQLACLACRRRLSSEEAAALESRFEATHVDFGEAKSLVHRGLTAALVAGSMTVMLALLRALLVGDASPPSSEPSPRAVAIADLLLGLLLVACGLGRRRFPALASVTALLIWAGSFLAPFVASPASAFLGMVSPLGIALTLARVAVLFLLARGVHAAFRMRRFAATAADIAESREPG